MRETHHNIRYLHIEVISSEQTMSKGKHSSRKTARMPATKFSHLQKKKLQKDAGRTNKKKKHGK